MDSSLDATIVYFECVNPDHRDSAQLTWGGLVIHKGKWSYCDGLGMGDDHSWAATGGARFGALRRTGSREFSEANDSTTGTEVLTEASLPA